MGRSWVLLVSLAGTGCLQAGVFHCGDDAQCKSGDGLGTCEATGYCSYPDLGCPLGRRYGTYAIADLADQCVTGQAGNATCGGPTVFTDNFDDGVTAPVWGQAFTSGSATYAETGGHLVITTLAGQSGQNYAGYITGLSYDLHESSLFVEVLGLPPASTHTDTYLVADADMNNALWILEEAGSLFFEQTLGGSQTMVVPSVPYDPVAQRWWRIRESAGMVYWETSPDGTTWNVGAMKPDPVDVSAIYPSLASGTYQSEPAMGTALFDNFNGGGAPAEAICKLERLQDGFDTGTLSGRWTTANSDTGCVTAQMGGVALFTPPTTIDGYCEFDTTGAYDLTGSYAALRVVQMVNVATQADAFMQVRLNMGNVLEIGQIGGVMHFTQRVGGTFSSVVADVTYDPVQQAWWRIREAAGITYWETSADGVSWTVRAMESDPWDESKVQVRMGAGTDTTIANAGSAKFDDFNRLP